MKQNKVIGIKQQINQCITNWMRVSQATGDKGMKTIVN